jgi:hypothetical protein
VGGRLRRAFSGPELPVTPLLVTTQSADTEPHCRHKRERYVETVNQGNHNSGGDDKKDFRKREFHYGNSCFFDVEIAVNDYPFPPWLNLVPKGPKAPKDTPMGVPDKGFGWSPVPDSRNAFVCGERQPSAPVVTVAGNRGRGPQSVLLGTCAVDVLHF